MINKSGGVLYLRVIGRLHSDSRLELRPSYLTSNAQNSGDLPNSPLTIELYDTGGKLLLRHGLQLTPYCADGAVVTELAVRGKIPFPAATSLLRFFHKGAMVHEIPVSEGKPQISLTWKPSTSMTGVHLVTWTATHPENLPLQFFLRYTHTGGERWQRASLRTSGNRQEFDFDQFPGGQHCRIAVVATDGVNTASAVSEEFSVPVKRCRTMIFAPADGATFNDGEEVWLRGQGFYLEEDSPETKELSWTSSQDGELGTGMAVRAENLSQGPHVVTLTAGAGPRAGQAQVSIIVKTEEKV